MVRLDGRAPYVQPRRIRFWLLRFRFSSERRRNRAVPRPAVTDKAAMLELTQDVYELTTRETAKQQTIVVTVRDREGWRSVAAALAMVGTWAANKPAIAVATALERSTDMICTHRGHPAKARLAIVQAVAWQKE
jgi:hypothetical protein